VALSTILSASDEWSLLNMEDLIFRAKLAEQAERHDDMISIMKEVLEQTQDLTVEQRNLLSVGYKNAVGLRRNAWRSFSSLE
jgi:hypothetical protein